jgi:hypothetical protein
MGTPQLIYRYQRDISGGCQYEEHKEGLNVVSPDPSSFAASSLQVLLDPNPVRETGHWSDFVRILEIYGVYGAVG